jgi:hypothetical protein
MPFTEFCCRASGNNLNAGSLDGGSTVTPTAAAVTYTGGDWTSGTDIYVAPVGADMTEAVVGRFASLYHDGDTSPTTNQYLVARITNVNAGTRSITLSTTARALLGTEVATGTGNRSLRIGGAWLGPSGADNWPFSMATTDALTNSSGDATRLNLMNDQTYSITATLSLGTSEINLVRGFASAYGDGGRAVIDGGTAGASFDLIDVGATAADVQLEDLELRNNGATGSAPGLDINSATATCRRVVIHDVRGNGFDGAASYLECEAYNCNQSNTATSGGFVMTGGFALRCVSHDNAGSNSRGFRASGGAALVECIADGNTSIGINLAGPAVVLRCDCYNNGGAGIDCPSALPVVLDSCNLIDNGGFGIAGNATGSMAQAYNCGFGSGTAANASGTTSNVPTEVGSVTYAADVTPWVDPANGDFRINLAAAKGGGRGAFLQTAPSYTGTVAYPDIGAAQSDASAGGGGGGGRVCRLGL